MFSDYAGNALQGTLGNCRLMMAHTKEQRLHQGIKKLEVPQEKIDGSQGDVHKHGNPHYWLNPNNGKQIAKQICQHLSQLDPQNAKVYRHNYT